MFLKTKIIITSIMVIALTTLIVGVLNIPNNFNPRPAVYESVEHPPKVEGILDKCGGIFVYDPIDLWYGTVPEGYDKVIPTQPMMVPAYGYMDAKPFGLENLGSYPSTFEGFTHEQILRALWDGVTIIWYDKSLDAESFEATSSYVNDQILSGSKMMLLPFNIKGKDLPMGRSFAYSNWNTTQSCDVFNLSTFQYFQKFVAETGNQPTGKPPVAPVDSDGRLRPIIPSAEY